MYINDCIWWPPKIKVYEKMCLTFVFIPSVIFLITSISHLSYHHPKWVFKSYRPLTLWMAIKMDLIFFFLWFEEIKGTTLQLAQLFMRINNFIWIALPNIIRKENIIISIILQVIVFQLFKSLNPWRCFSFILALYTFIKTCK